jgi:hypothetical protein
VESVSVNQNVSGRIFNFGNITIMGTGGKRETVKAIADPLAARKNVNIIIDEICSHILNINNKGPQGQFKN